MQTHSSLSLSTLEREYRWMWRRGREQVQLYPPDSPFLSVYKGSSWLRTDRRAGVLWPADPSSADAWRRASGGLVEGGEQVEQVKPLAASRQEQTPPCSLLSFQWSDGSFVWQCTWPNRWICVSEHVAILPLLSDDNRMRAETVISCANAHVLFWSCWALLQCGAQPKHKQNTQSLFVILKNLTCIIIVTQLALHNVSFYRFIILIVDRTLTVTNYAIWSLPEKWKTVLRGRCVSSADCVEKGYFQRNSFRNKPMFQLAFVNPNWKNETLITSFTVIFPVYILPMSSGKRIGSPITVAHEPCQHTL